MAEEKKDTTQPILIQKIDIRQINRSTQDIDSWRSAIRSAESIINPTRKLLYDLYSDLLLDGHLTAVIGKRINAVLNHPLTFVDASGKEVEAITELMDSEEFEEILTEILNSRFWGYTLLELEFTPDKIKPHLVDRRHVKPEKKIVVRNPSEITGVNYTEPPYDRYVISAGKTKDLGLLMKVAQYVIYKRGNFGDWAQFAEIFGMPFRKGSYDGFDENARIKLSDALEGAGSAAFAIIPEGTELEFISNNSTGDGELYDKLRKACNEEISVCIAGNTLTTSQGDKGSRSLGEVHEGVQDELEMGDRRFVRRILNSKLKPLMEMHGYPVKGGEFLFPEVDQIDQEKKIVIDMKVAERQPVSDDYFYETYGIPKPEDYDKLKEEQTVKKSMFQPPQPPLPVGAPKPDKIGNLYAGVKDFGFKGLFGIAPAVPGIEDIVTPLYDCPRCGGVHDVVNLSEDELKAIDARVSQIVADIFNGTLKAGEMDDELIRLTAAKLREGVFSGYGAGFDTVETGTSDFKMIQNLERNVYQFASAKNWQQMKRMTQALKDADGKIRPYSEFKVIANDINRVFNHSWLQTEYNFAVNSAEAAANWAQYESGSSDMEMLQYETVGDDRVRAEHADLDKVVRKLSDSFWDEYYPPNGWGCRCTTIQLTDPNATETNMARVNVPEVPPIFKVNLAKQGLAFPQGHPYYAMGKADAKKVTLKAEQLTPKR